MTKPLESEHVAVLLGGISPEREVSLVSGRECADALERLGAKGSRVDAGRNLAAVLTKAGALAAAQPQSTVVLVTALGQDFAYLNQAVWKGVPAQRMSKVSFENRTAGLGQPYSVSIRTVQ